MPAKTEHRDANEWAFLGCVFRDSDILVSSYLTETMFTTHRATFRNLSTLAEKTKIDADDVARIIRDLMATYAGVPAGYMDLTGWEAETAAHLGT